MTSEEEIVAALHIFLELEANAQNKYEVNEDNGVVDWLRCDQTSFQILLSVKRNLGRNYRRQHYRVCCQEVLSH